MENPNAVEEYSAIPPLYLGTLVSGLPLFNDFVENNRLQIMGSMGSGKTTLMNKLAEQSLVDPNLTVHFFNGRTAEMRNSDELTVEEPEGRIKRYSGGDEMLDGLKAITTRMHGRLRTIWHTRDENWQTSKEPMPPELIFIDDSWLMPKVMIEELASIDMTGPATGFYLVISSGKLDGYSVMRSVTLRSDGKTAQIYTADGPIQFKLI